MPDSILKLPKSENLARIRPLLVKTVTDSRSWQFPADLNAENSRTLAFLNQHGINTALKNASFYDFLMNSDYLLRDGIGVKIALKLFGMGDTENLNGTDLITRLVYRFKNNKLAILGASDEAIAACRTRLQQEGITGIVAAENGFHDENFYLQLCRQVKPEIIILCMGMPKQELLAKKLQQECLASLIVCGGGWADFYSGVKIRAPLWVQKLSLEWLHRLLKEPKRLGKRYTVDILYYFCVITLARFKKT